MRKHSVKLLSFILAIVMIVTSVHLPAFAFDLSESESLETYNQNLKTNNEITELTEKRTQTSKYFRLEDGSVYVAQYDTPIHYLDEKKEL